MSLVKMVRCLFKCYPSSETPNAREAGAGFMGEQDSAGFEERFERKVEKTHVHALKGQLTCP